MDDDLEEYPTQRVRLQQCQICGRQFNADILKKHQAICRKVTSKKRKVFDAGKQRATDSDVPYKATKQTMKVYMGDAPVQEDRSRLKSKPNWREKHQQLIRSIREARSVTQAIKTGGPLPAFRPSEVPSDYVACPYCRRNFNANAADRHIPFCQAQHQRKQVQPPKSKQQFDRGRTLPPQHSSAYSKQQPPNSGMHPKSHDVYENGYKHSNSAPMIPRRNPPEYQAPSPPLPPPPQLAQKSSSNGGWGGFRKLFGLGPKEEIKSPADYYTPEDEDDYQPSARHPQQQPILMRTGRTQQNTSLNVRARERSGDMNSYGRRVPQPAQNGPSSYGQTRPQYGNGQYNSSRPTGNGQYNSPRPTGNGQYNSSRPTGNGQYNSSRPTAVGRMPAHATTTRCGDCGSMFNNSTAHYCPQCGSRR